MKEAGDSLAVRSGMSHEIRSRVRRAETTPVRPVLFAKTSQFPRPAPLTPPAHLGGLPPGSLQSRLQHRWHSSHTNVAAPVENAREYLTQPRSAVIHITARDRQEEGGVQSARWYRQIRGVNRCPTITALKEHADPEYLRPPVLYAKPGLAFVMGDKAELRLERRSRTGARTATSAAVTGGAPPPPRTESRRRLRSNDARSASALRRCSRAMPARGNRRPG